MNYVPKQGDLIVLNFDPQAGHEQKGRRPALVVSKEAFNRAMKMAICCPITNTDRGIPLQVPVPETTGLTGYVMVEQVKSIDYQSRAARRISAAPESLLSEVLAMLDACIYDSGV